MTRTALSTSAAALLFVAACSGGSPSSPSSPAASLDGPSIDGGVVVRPSASLADAGEQEVAIDGDRAMVLKAAPGKGRGQSQGKVVLCHRDGNGYHSIEVSVNAEPAHRAHGDARPGEPIPADPTRQFDSSCGAVSPDAGLVSIRKLTNGQDVSQAPGPSIKVGSAVIWTYVVTNTGNITFSSNVVTDDRGVNVACPKLLLSPGASMTCNGSGVAVAGQYRNVGTVVAVANGVTHTASDASYYFGVTDDASGPKVQLCHRTGNSGYNLISVDSSDEAAHRSHGDAKPGEAVPGNPGRIFTASCAVS